jgi:hypothetical protein
LPPSQGPERLRYFRFREVYGTKLKARDNSLAFS